MKLEIIAQGGCLEINSTHREFPYYSINWQWPNDHSSTNGEMRLSTRFASAVEYYIQVGDPMDVNLG